jgi:hypothetical protein
MHRVARRTSVLFLVHFVVALAARGASAQSVPKIAVPDPRLFPGVANPDITAANINQNICNKGWSTRSIRPPSSYTTSLKKAQFQTLNYTRVNPLPQIPTKSGNGTKADVSKCITDSNNVACYEGDHLISLEIGGDPRSPDNLWPEPYFGQWNARVKDQLENKLHDMVCKGTITLTDAQAAIATDWVAAYQKFVQPVPPTP